MKTISPKNANTQFKLNSLKRDNKQCGKCDIMVHEDSVSLFPDSKITNNWISISKKDFNKIIAWYIKEQRIRL